MALYAYWMFHDRQTPVSSGRRWTWLRRLRFWHFFRSYFPVQVIRSQKIDPKKKYVIGINPHGIWSVSAWANFVSDNNAFPGLDYRIVTVSPNFYVPFWREFVLGLGAIDASRESCKDCLRKNISVAIVVGGAAEALDARPGTNTLVLARRFGFIRLAIEHGADLVPVFSFGENALYYQFPNPPGSRIRSIQNWMISVFGFYFPLLGNLLPRRRPIITVIGDPISVPYDSNPSRSLISTVHAQYVKALYELYNTHKHLDQSVVNDLDIGNYTTSKL
jgi:2-acylglycerol O-acyltransferase 2